MTKPLVLADSSAWSHFLRQGDSHPSGILLKTFLQQDVVATTWIIRLELLSGTPTEEAYRALDADVAELRQLPLTDPLFQAASALRWRLQRKGIAIPVTDCLIATCAIFYDCALLHDDRHFPLIARHAPLRLYPAHAPRA